MGISQGLQSVLWGMFRILPVTSWAIIAVHSWEKEFCARLQNFIYRKGRMVMSARLVGITMN
jgi:hypothetical protein